MSPTLNQAVEFVHKNAVEKGWHDSPRSAAEVHMLIVTEIAEATESVRSHEPPVFQNQEDSLDGHKISIKVTPGDPRWNSDLKPEGEATELADAVIRIMDYFGSKGWDLEEVVKMKHLYNKTRPHRHGGKAL